MRGNETHTFRFLAVADPTAPLGTNNDAEGVVIGEGDVALGAAPMGIAKPEVHADPGVSVGLSSGELTTVVGDCSNEALFLRNRGKVAMSVAQVSMVTEHGSYTLAGPEVPFVLSPGVSTVGSLRSAQRR